MGNWYSGYIEVVNKNPAGEKITGTVTSTGTAGSTEYAYPYSKPIQEGWLCPRCKRINAPWVAQCSCVQQYEVTWVYPYYPQWYEPWTYTDTVSTDANVPYSAWEGWYVDGEGYNGSSDCEE